MKEIVGLVAGTVVMNVVYSNAKCREVVGNKLEEIGLKEETGMKEIGLLTASVVAGVVVTKVINKRL